MEYYAWKRYPFLKGKDLSTGERESWWMHRHTHIRDVIQ